MNVNQHLHWAKGIPVVAESTQIQRDLSILEYTEGAMHIASVSSIEGVESIREAKSKGLNVTASVNIHHLVFLMRIWRTIILH